MTDFKADHIIMNAHNDNNIGCLINDHVLIHATNNNNDCSIHHHAISQ